MNERQRKIRNLLIVSGIGLITMLLLLFSACNDNLDIQQVYGFELETLPVDKKVKVGEKVEIRCQLKREGYYKKTKFYLRYFQPDGTGELSMDNGTVFTPNDLFPLEKETFRLYYKSLGTESHTIDIYILDNFGQMTQKTFSFQHDSE